MIRNLQEGSIPVEVQETTFSIDVLGRYICNTYEEAANNGGFPFDAVVIGAGMYGAYIAEKIYRQGQGNLRVLVLEAGSLLVTEHIQNLSRIGLNAAGPVTVDPGTPRERASCTIFSMRPPRSPRAITMRSMDAPASRASCTV